MAEVAAEDTASVRAGARTDTAEGTAAGPTAGGARYEPFYVERGEGFPLVLLHGNGESHEYFVHQIEHFSRSWRVMALDTRGHGRSPRGDGEFTIARFAEDLSNFLTARGIGRAHLLGFSDGGNIALQFALDHREMVGRLVLNGANLFPAGVKRSVQIPIEVEYRLLKPFAGVSERARRKTELLGLMVNEPNVDPSELRELAIPTLVVAGTDDMIAREHTELIARSLPDSQLALIPGSHFVAAENPEAFNAVVDDFLNRGESRGAAAGV